MEVVYEGGARWLRNGATAPCSWSVKPNGEALMSVEVDALCGAPYGARTRQRVNARNGSRSRR